MDSIEGMSKGMDMVYEALERPARSEKMDAKKEAKHLLNYLFRIPARAPEDYSADTIDRLIDLIIQAAVEETEDRARKDNVCKSDGKL